MFNNNKINEPFWKTQTFEQSFRFNGNYAFEYGVASKMKIKIINQGLCGVRIYKHR